MSVEENKRNSSIELIRIIAMFMIVLSHSVTHGEYETENVFNKIILDWFTLGNIGNHLFILISGYYLCEKVNYKSICKLISQVWCYSLIIFIFCSLFGYQYSFENILEVFFPVVFREYWFITAYIVLVLISPILNIFIKNVSKTSFKAILLVMVCMWIIIPTFTIFQTNLYGDVLPQFMLIYLVGAYFRKYPNNILEIKRIRFLMLVSSVILLYLSTLIIELAGKIIPFAQEKGGIMFAKNSILIVSIAIAIFTSAIYTLTT